MPLPSALPLGILNMINLIPIEKKKEIRKEFYFRLLCLGFVILGVCFLIYSVLMLPAYFVSYQKKNLLTQKLEIQNNQIIPEVDSKAQAEITSLENKLKLILGAIDKKYIFSDKVLNEILLRKSNKIKIDGIYFKNDPKEKKIVVSGTASSREDLLSFRRSFELSKIFSVVDLPISNFIKGKDIEFRLNLTAL